MIWEGSSLLKDMREKATREGKAEGQAEGEKKGQAAEALRLLRVVLADRFPGLEAMPELERITDVATLESLFLGRVLKSTDREQVESAIRSAAVGKH